MFAVSSSLLLVFLESYAVGHLKGIVFRHVVCSFSKTHGFFLGFSSSILVGFRAGEEIGAEIIECLKCHGSEITCPLPQLGGLPGCREAGVPIGWGREGGVPKNFPQFSSGWWCNDSETNWTVIASDSEVWSSTGPELRSEVWGGEKEIDYSGVFLLTFGWPRGAGISIGRKRAGNPQIMGRQKFTDGRGTIDFPWPFTRPHVRSYAVPEFRELGVEVAAPEQTASGCGMDEGL